MLSIRCCQYLFLFLLIFYVTSIVFDRCGSIYQTRRAVLLHLGRSSGAFWNAENQIFSLVSVKSSESTLGLLLAIFYKSPHSPRVNTGNMKEENENDEENQNQKSAMINISTGSCRFARMFAVGMFELYCSFIFFACVILYMLVKNQKLATLHIIANNYACWLDSAVFFSSLPGSH